MRSIFGHDHDSSPDIVIPIIIEIFFIFLYQTNQTIQSSLFHTKFPQSKCIFDLLFDNTTKRIKIISNAE